MMTRCSYTWIPENRVKTEEEQEAEKLLEGLKKMGAGVEKSEVKYIIEISITDNNKTASDFNSNKVGYTEKQIEDKTKGVVDNERRKNKVARMSEADREQHIKEVEANAKSNFTNMSNEATDLDGIGEAAHFILQTPPHYTILRVLHGGKRVDLTVAVGESHLENMKMAKKIARDIF